MRALRIGAWLGVALCAANLHAQFVFSDATTGPAMSTPMPRLRYIVTDAEAEQTTSDSTRGGIGREQLTRFYVSPRIGISWDYFIFHPYLLNWAALFEPGYVWRDQTFAGQKNSSQEFVVNSSATVNILQAKPYATTLNYNQSRDDIHYDFFTPAIVDSRGWGATSGYREGAIPFNVSFQQTHENSSAFDQTLITDQTTVNLDARNERGKQNATDLIYQFNQFDRETILPGASYRTENTYQHLALTDMEYFNRGTLRSMIRYDDRATDVSSSSDLNATEDYHIDLTPSLTGYADYSFSRFATDDSDSIQNYGILGIQHQLYESLATGVEVHGSTFDNRSDGSTFNSESVGTTASATYTKRLGGWGRLMIANSSSFNFTEQKTTGSELLIANESYTVPTNGLVRLTQPRQIAIVSITDSNNNPLLEGQDYTVIQSTDPWQIQILTTGPAHIHAGSIILVTYTVRANPSGNYSVFGNQTEVRLSFWSDKASVYARYNFTDNHASSPEFLLQDQNLFAAGAEYIWRGFRFNADYINLHSTLYDSEGISLGESYSMSLSSRSTIGVDLIQQWSNNRFHNDSIANENEDLSYYSFMFHYQWRPINSLECNVEAGYLHQRGILDEDLFAARAYVNWNVGKLQVRLGYEHGYRDINGELEDRDFGFLRLKRMF